ncbi:MAG: efflux RND transporter periplasmic adaptor subunit [Burkholderiales bacterium]|nr:efflux RND transporter periplasmic adaptor subunit [Burkholderiales bacterium]
MPDSTRARWGRRALVLLPLLALAATLVWWLGRPKPVPVITAEVGRGTVESTVANTRAGTVEACQRTKLSTIAGGRIEVLAVKEGDKVKKGQLLMRLWNDDQQAEQSLAQAQLETARRRVAEACTLAELAQREFKRQEQLFQQGFISDGALDNLRSQADARVASCATARSDVTQAQARLKLVGTAQQRTVLVAPFDGTVAKIVGEVGEYSTPSPPGVAMPPAIDLIDETCLYVAAPMDEVDAPKIAIGQPVRITLDALPGKAFAGKVRRIAPYVTAVEKQARTVEVEVNFDDPQSAGRLLVGYSADVEVILDVRKDALRVPSSALLQGGRVLLLQEGQLLERPVKAGLANWEHTEIVEGLQGGERIVTSLDRAGVKAGARAVEEAPAR